MRVRETLHTGVQSCVLICTHMLSRSDQCTIAVRRADDTKINNIPHLTINAHSPVITQVRNGISNCCGRFIVLFAYSIMLRDVTFVLYDFAKLEGDTYIFRPMLFAMYEMRCGLCYLSGANH